MDQGVGVDFQGWMQYDMSWNRTREGSHSVGRCSNRPTTYERMSLITLKGNYSHSQVVLSKGEEGSYCSPAAVWKEQF